MCACQSHIVCHLMAVKYFDWDYATNTKLRAECGLGFEDIVFHRVWRPGQAMQKPRRPDRIWQWESRHHWAFKMSSPNRFMPEPPSEPAS
jgi:hypothetical protein